MFLVTFTEYNDQIWTLNRLTLCCHVSDPIWTLNRLTLCCHVSICHIIIYDTHAFVLSVIWRGEVGKSVFMVSFIVSSWHCHLYHAVALISLSTWCHSCYFVKLMSVIMISLIKLHDTYVCLHFVICITWRHGCICWPYVKRTKMTEMHDMTSCKWHQRITDIHVSPYGCTKQQTRCRAFLLRKWTKRQL